MPTLSEYVTDTERLLNQTNQSQNLYPQGVLTSYINRARLRVAAKGECVRLVPQISSSVVQISISNAGSGYPSTPTVTISAPDQLGGTQATAIVTLGGTSALTGATITNAGFGYFSPNPPTVSVTSSVGGTTAVLTATLASNINQTVTNQEVYPFAAVNLGSGNGIASILAVRQVNFIWGTWRYTRVATSFSKYKALISSYQNYQDIPAVVAQFAQGVQGSLYMYPIANGNYQMEWDCTCLPSPLTSDSSFEAIPYPWTDAVPYYAAYLALIGSQRTDQSKEFLGEYTRLMKEARQTSQVGAVANWYGRAP